MTGLIQEKQKETQPETFSNRLPKVLKGSTPKGSGYLGDLPRERAAIRNGNSEGHMGIQKICLTYY